MSLNYWDFIYLSPGFEPEKNTLETNSGICRFKSIGIDVFKKELVIEVAKNLVSEGRCADNRNLWRICSILGYKN